MSFKKIDITMINENTINLFKKDTPIVVCGNIEHHNGLTVAWGSLGCLWRKSIATIYIKPTRYSFEFMNNCEYFSIMWFDENQRPKINQVFGTMSGRDVDKESMCQLSSFELDHAVAYQEAKMIIVCKKIYQNELVSKQIIDEEIKNLPLYQDNLYHHEYIGEIIGCYLKE